MIYPDISMEKWLNKYPSLKQAKPVKCLQCSEEIYHTRPFIDNDYAGLLSEYCPNCNNKQKTYVIIPISKSELAAWDVF